mgnify:CR=1 FL=1
MADQQASVITWFSQLSDLTVLGILLSIAGAAMLLYLWHSRRSRAEVLVLGLQEMLRVQQAKLDAQNSALAVMGERVLALEDYLEMVGSRQQQLDSDKRDLRFYQQAIRLADQGLGSDELVRQCGISRSEAELLAAVRSSH